MAIPRDRQSAKELVQQIAKDHGYLGEEKLRRIPEQDLRREIEEAFLKKDLMIGSTVITLAKNLYTSKARFVFELLQNADDNKFEKAVALGSVPFVSFRVYPRKIVLECNEDGFNRDNLVAICSVGKSSKTGAQGYIGEKGIGFKSVFMAAWKAHIQSGSFSFSFTHRNGDSGMGMISPVWEEASDQPTSQLTRITLHLHDTGDADVLKKTREIIQEQFEELEETILLFMKNLRRVNVSFYDEDGDETSSAAYSIKRPRTTFAILERTKTINGTTQTQVKHFHVTTHQATNLAKNENRTYSDTEEATRAYSKSQITLAFPVTEASVPVIEPQNVFVFLPVRPVGFKFLIQADFVTDASRQDIVRDSLRNNGLIDGIAEAFVKAILQFCRHDTLRYQWMRYLPDKNSTNWNGLWLALVNRIASGLARAAVLYGQKRADGRLIRDLVRLQTDHLDENGEPLFDDVEPEQMISRRYRDSDLDLLRSYGLEYAKFSHVFEWLKNDISQWWRSRMRSAATSDSWHTRVARLLQKSVDLPLNYTWKHVLKTIDILPLDDGTWTSISSGPVYLGQTAGLDIPPGVNMRLISKKVTNSTRLKLFKALDVETAGAALVREKILARYSQTGSMESVTFATSKQHLEFLYLTEHLKSNREGFNAFEYLTIHDTTSRMHKPHSVDMYLVNAEPCGASELFKRTSPGRNPGDGAPGYPAVFVHEDYFKNAPAKTIKQTLGWMEWFTKELRVLTYVRFDIPNYQNHKNIEVYLRDKRPDRFLNAVQVFYQRSGGIIWPSFKERLPKMEVLCRGNRRVPLKDAYLPTTELERQVQRFVEPNAFFPWLRLNVDDTPNVAISEWQSFLADVEVGSPATALDFALDMLKYSLDAFPDTPTDRGKVRLFNLYDHIETEYRGCEDKESAKKKIRYIFDRSKLIYIPIARDRHTWAFPNQCVWDAPHELSTKYALRLLYQPLFRLHDADSDYSARFFTNTLGISDCTWDVYVEELKSLSATGCNDSDKMCNIYKALDTLRPTLIGIDKTNLKDAFENNALIYVPSNNGPAWHKASQCVWSSAATLRGRVSLNDDYEDLEEFFVKFLGVRMVDLTMAIDELKEAGGRQWTSIQDIKESIWTVNSLLPTSTKLPKPEKVMENCIFPIKLPNGTYTRGSITTEFSIVDRENLGELFRTKVKLLDFTLQEVVRLRPFLNWMHLDTRYLSQCVKEITSFHGAAARLISDPNRQIWNRAHALLRIACHFNSPRTQIDRDAKAFYELLKSTEILQTDGISSDLCLVQDGNPHQLDGTMISLHIDETQSGLKIYLPRNKDTQEYAFTTLLSQKLFDWMMRNPTTQIPGQASKDGVSATKDILVSPRATIHMALEANGIAPSDIANDDEQILLDLDCPSTPRGASEDESRHSSSSDQDDSDSENLATPASSVMSPPLSRHRADISSRYMLHTPTRPPLRYGDPFVFAAPSPSPTPALQAHEQQKYVELLGKVISAARRGCFPSHGAFGMSQLLNDLPRVDAMPDFGLRSASQIERDCKIGAAGELYVFELLSHLIEDRRLPLFSRENWQSTVRKYISVHPQYADMEPWNGRETSDITYADSESVLTNFLIEKGYLAREDWAGKTPKYFIEVKTTTLSCSTQLYMSKSQYRRMQENTLTPENRDTIYVIFRVFNLGRDDMGLKVYLDPEALRVSGHLQFTAESWTVTPGPVA